MKRLVLYSTAHFVVDFSCAFLLFALTERFSTSASPESGDVSFLSTRIAAFFLFYNVLAFGTEFFIGLWGRETGARLRACGGISALLAALGGGFSLLSPSASSGIADGATSTLAILTVLAAGLGNSFFHLGGGVDALAQSLGRKKKYWRNGVFISTGALGLAAGTLVGSSESRPFAAIAAALTLVGVGIWIWGKIDASERAVSAWSGSVKNADFAFWSAFLGATAATTAVVVRSFAGFFAPALAAERISALATASPLFLASAAFLGKAFGGFFADRFGGAAVGVGATLAAIPALCWSDSAPVFWGGVVLLNVSTAITLVATAENCGGRLGFAFGLTTLALLVGYFATEPALSSFGVDRVDFERCDRSATRLAAAVLVVAALGIGIAVESTKRRKGAKPNGGADAAKK